MEPMSLPKDRMQEKDAVAEGLTPRQGRGIWMTLVLKPEIDPNHASMITLVTALAVSKAITDMTGRPASIKWPNDIIMSGKKCAAF